MSGARESDDLGCWVGVENAADRATGGQTRQTRVKPRVQSGRIRRISSVIGITGYV